MSELGWPKSVKIGPFKYKLETHDDLIYLDEFNVTALGYCDKGNLEIHISERYDNLHLADTALHEIGHAIFGHCGISNNPELEVRVVSCMATGYLQVFKDNPRLLEKLNQIIKEKK